MDPNSPLAPLVELGLTELESEIYAYLIENSPATGYRTARVLGKPTANTYKALASLSEKGAIQAEDGQKRLYRAVPADELLADMERRFKGLKEQAAASLSKLKPSPDDERVYHLHTPGQVFERFRQMLSRCEEVALLDLFPGPATELKSDIEAAVLRGRAVAVKLYEPCDIPGAEVVVDPAGVETLSRWPGRWANGVIDGREHLLSLLSADGQRVHQAVWSSNVYSSWAYHSGLAFELIHPAMIQELNKSDRTPEFKYLFDRWADLRKINAPGYRILMDRFGDDRGEEKSEEKEPENDHQSKEDEK